MGGAEKFLQLNKGFYEVYLSGRMMKLMVVYGDLEKREGGLRDIGRGGLVRSLWDLELELRGMKLNGRGWKETKVSMEINGKGEYLKRICKGLVGAEKFLQLNKGKTKSEYGN